MQYIIRVIGSLLLATGRAPISRDPLYKTSMTLRDRRVNFQLTTERNETEIDQNFKSRSVVSRDV
jgi:hypothetical protein